MALAFNLRFEPAHGTSVRVAPDILRVTASNASPFTFHGTNSYIVGRDTLAVIDPGPDDDAHLQTLVSAIAGRPVSHIFVSHTHRDHSPLAVKLKAATGAIVLAEGPHRPARALAVGETARIDAGGDMNFRPDVSLPDHSLTQGDGWALRTVLTPGHTANHAAFALEGTGILFSADHVMAWSTTVVAPPDGSMSEYMSSLDKLIERGDRMLLPGHGGPVTAPRTFMRGLKTHRRMRERAIVERLRKGDLRVADIVKAIYRDTDPRLHGAAALSTLAHLEDLVARGLVKSEGPPTIDAIFILA